MNCRHCNSTIEFNFLDLGSSPPSNAYLEINQLENNLQFFSNVKDDNPMVKEVHKNIDKHKAALQTWNAKYSKIKKMIQ